MLRLTLCGLLAATCAWLSACGSSSDTPTTAPKIDDGVRYVYELGDGSPEEAAAVMRRRLARAKIKGWASAQGDTIVVDLAETDAETLAATRDLIARTAKLRIQVIDEGDPAMRRLAQHAKHDPSAQADGIEADVDQWRGPAGDEHLGLYLRATDGEETVDLATARRLGCFHRDMVDAHQVRCRVTGRARIERYLDAARQRDPSLALPDDHQLAFERLTPHDRAPYWRSYYVVRASTLSSPGIANARPVVVDPDSGRTGVQIELDDDARTAFAELSRASLGKKLAVILDDRVIIAPVINAPITSGRLTINLYDDAREGEARQLAIALASGPLPGPVVEASAAQLKDGKVVAAPLDF